MNKPADAFGLDGVRTYDEATAFLAGIECEMESVIPGQEFTGFKATEDGSLRNRGMEYISRPFTVPKLLGYFSDMQASIQFVDKKEAFSPRTSTHVHINCRSLSLEQIRNLMLIYALFEEYFFLMVEPVRRTNIHCVPLTDTHLPCLYHKDIKSLINKWHKYTALNLLPLTRQGTVEFRHLQGTGDAAVLSEWLTTLQNLWTISQKEMLTPEMLLDSRKLRELWEQVFAASPRVLSNGVLFDSLIKSSLVDVKLSFIQG